MTPEPVDIDDLLGDIIKWGERVNSYISGHTFEAFLANIEKQDATIRCLEVMGEAAGNILRIDPEFQLRHPELRLREAYRARNRTAHGYGSINLDAIWETATGPSRELTAAAYAVLASRQGNALP